MVHALTEVRRVLVPGGILIDIRPLSDRWPIEVVSTRGARETGRVDDFPEPLNADRASNEAMNEVEARDWFKREQEQYFPYFYSWDTPSEMEEFVAEDWSDFVGLNEDAKMRTRSTWASSDADARVRVKVRILITRWNVIKG
ncbi:MAG TPA: hypothetical protein VFY66_00940 [Anaerolineales bacterium]|nr:hypothetical protein [Anaerolineales bacterium]